RHFSGAGVVRLEENYRSTPQVLAAAHAVLPGGARRRKPLRPTVADGPVPTVTAHPSDRDEAAAVARALQAAHQPGPPWSGPAARPPGATGGSTSTSWSGWATTTWRPTRLSRRGAPSYRPAPPPEGSSPGSSPSWPTTIPPPPTPWSS